MGGGFDLALCDPCSKKRGIVAGGGSLDLRIEELIGTGLATDRPRSSSSRACPGCGMDAATLKREGRLGCPDCAESFLPEILAALSSRSTVSKEGPTLGRIEAQGENKVEKAGPREDAGARLRERLAKALADEDYEAAAAIRDTLAAPRTPSFMDSPYAAPAQGPCDDVALWTSARAYRNIEGLPFAGSVKGGPAPTREFALRKLESAGGWRTTRLASLDRSARRSLSERGIIPRGYASDDDAVVVEREDSPLYALLDDGDHLRLRSVAPGLDVSAAFDSVRGQAESLGRDFDFLSKEEFGWVCSRLGDCGLGLSASVAFHLPALEATGLRERLLRALMAKGFGMRGLYSTREDSLGSVFELFVEPASFRSAEELESSLGEAARTVVAAERKARGELAGKGGSPLIDAEGRAYGIARHCALLGVDEAAALVSALRLACLRGSLVGVDPRRLGALLLALGPGSIVASAKSGREEGWPPQSLIDGLRARIVKETLEGADYKGEEASACSRA